MNSYQEALNRVRFVFSFIGALLFGIGQYMGVEPSLDLTIYGIALVATAWIAFIIKEMIDRVPVLIPIKIKVEPTDF